MVDRSRLTTSGQKMNGEVGGSGDAQLEKKRKKETNHKHDDPSFEGKVKEEGLMKRKCSLSGKQRDKKQLRVLSIDY